MPLAPARSIVSYAKLGVGSTHWRHSASLAQLAERCLDAAKVVRAELTRRTKDLYPSLAQLVEAPVLHAGGRRGRTYRTDYAV